MLGWPVECAPAVFPNVETVKMQAELAAAYALLSQAYSAMGLVDEGSPETVRAILASRDAIRAFLQADPISLVSPPPVSSQDGEGG
jgi:hypothetical protein